MKVAQGQKAGTEHYEEIGDYDYNNPNDTSNFCPGLQVSRGKHYVLFSAGSLLPLSFPVGHSELVGVCVCLPCPRPQN